MDADNSFASNSALAQSARGRWRYLALFGTQTVAAVVLYWTGLLLYRQVLADPRSYPVQPWTSVWSLSSIVVMQIGYWISYHLPPPLPRFRNVLLGHAVLFLGRMAFVLSTSAYGFVFVARRPEFEIPVFQCIVLLLGLFALYCYVRELERLGRAFISRVKGFDALAR